MTTRGGPLPFPLPLTDGGRMFCSEVSGETCMGFWMLRTGFGARGRDRVHDASEVSLRVWNQVEY